MKIKELKLKNYRNCEDVELIFDSTKNIIIGKNAQGKTNLLESIYFLSSLKTPRTTNLLELINFSSLGVEINSVVEKSGVEIEQDFIYTKEKKRELKINKVKSTKPKNFKNIIKTVLFSSHDLSLLRGNPQDRRDWLDTAISQIFPAYDERISKYNKIKTQKNNLLKKEIADDTLLEVYNEQLSVLGSNIIFLRIKFLKEIEKIARQKHKSISEEETLEIKYECGFLEEKDLSIEEIQSKYKAKQKEKIQIEKIRRQTLTGPHRDDVVFYINGQEATKFASQGQQRTVVLALKMAELEMITEKTGEPPILLLDDVLAELDDTRQNYLLKTIEEDIQTIITSVDTLLFDEKFLKGVNLFTIEDGRIIKKERA